MYNNMVNETWKKKLDENGQPLMVNGDFVMELVSSETLPDPIEPPNWDKLEQDLFYSPLLDKAETQANPNSFSIFLKVLTNGIRGRSSEAVLLSRLQRLGVNWTPSEITELNTILSNNHFTISL